MAGGRAGETGAWVAKLCQSFWEPADAGVAGRSGVAGACRDTQHALWQLAQAHWARAGLDDGNSAAAKTVSVRTSNPLITMANTIFTAA